MATAKTGVKTAKRASGNSSKTASKEKSITELTAVLAERTGTTKAQARTFLDAHAEILTEELKSNGSVQIAGIGKFKVGDRAERQGRNPSTGEAITIKATKTIRFSGGKRFKDSVN